MKRLRDKKAIVTGAAQGLGAAIVEHLAEEGCDVVAWDIQLDKVQQTAHEIGERTGRMIAAAAVDVSDADAVRHTVEQNVRELGGLDVFVSNAGILISGDSLEFEPAQWRRVIDVNLVGYFICAREAARAMLQTGGGSIIQINSKSGKKGSFRNSAYAASKFGGIGVTQSLALEFAEQGIRVNSVCPGNLLDSPLWVDSLYEQYAKRWNMTVEQVRQKYVDQVPLGRGCSYDDVANAMVFLCQDETSYITGQAINVDGGQTMH